MEKPASRISTRATVERSLRALDRAGFRGLKFFPELEDRFEEDTRRARSYRMWYEGLIAIVGLNICLTLDYLVVRDIAWLITVRNTALVTPLALAVNLLVRRNPVGWLREGSIAAAMIAICFVNLRVEGNATASAALFGAICTLITALFVGVVMRLRFPWVVACICVMLCACFWSLTHAPAMRLSEAVIAESLLTIGMGIILVTSHSLERQERKGYLLCLQRDLQAEELERINHELQRLSAVDKLTGLPNRRALEDRFEVLWSACTRSRVPVSAIVIDVDHFKRVNDLHGHLYGDETLRRIASLLTQALRSPEDMAARFGGEEFVLLLPRADAEVALLVAERVRQLVEAAGTPPHSSDAREKGMWITVSCGVSCCLPVEGATWTGLIAAADEALYAAKRGGRNRVEFSLLSHQDGSFSFPTDLSPSACIR